MKAQTPALERAQAVWEQAMRLEASLRWHVLTPTSLAATGERDPARRRPDGSVMASGANPGEAIYTIEASDDACRASRRFASRRCRIRRCRKAGLAATSTATSR